MELQRLLAAAHTCVELAQGRVRFQHSGEDTRGFAVHLLLSRLGLGKLSSHLLVVGLNLLAAREVRQCEIQRGGLLIEKGQVSAASPEQRLDIGGLCAQRARCVEDDALIVMSAQAARGDVEVQGEPQLVPLDIGLGSPLGRDLQIQHCLLVPSARPREEPLLKQSGPEVLLAHRPIQPLLRPSDVGGYDAVCGRIEAHVPPRHRLRRLPSARFLGNLLVALGDERRAHPLTKFPALHRDDLLDGLGPKFGWCDAELGVGRGTRVGTNNINDGAWGHAQHCSLENLSVESLAECEPQPRPGGPS
mmetsp:Transcript_11738/g.33871  ORF Transcript_11738/g.33871 Transcript_11738/m.33871 type:complete len:304 (-) Transcript_11738:232-1143(-)